MRPGHGEQDESSNFHPDCHIYAQRLDKSRMETYLQFASELRLGVFIITWGTAGKLKVKNGDRHRISVVKIY